MIRNIGKIVVAILLASIALRSATPVLHVHTLSEGVSIGAPCYACDIDSTAAFHVDDTPVLPVLTFTRCEDPSLPEARPFLAPNHRVTGRAPPSC